MQFLSHQVIKSSSHHIRYKILCLIKGILVQVDPQLFFQTSTLPLKAAGKNENIFKYKLCGYLPAIYMIYQQIIQTMTELRVHYSGIRQQNYLVILNLYQTVDPFNNKYQKKKKNRVLQWLRHFGLLIFAIHQLLIDCYCVSVL